MPNFVKIIHTRYHIFQFLRWPPSAILDFQIFKILVADLVEMTNVHRHLNFVKIGKTVAEISHLTIFKMAAVHHLGFLNI